jgi:hypothetical protein
MRGGSTAQIEAPDNGCQEDDPQGLPQVHVVAFQHDAGQVSADGEEHRMAEGEHAGDAKNQVEAEGIQGQDKDFDAQTLHEFACSAGVRPYNGG